jgi:hypothetical protein
MLPTTSSRAAASCEYADKFSLSIKYKKMFKYLIDCKFLYRNFVPRTKVGKSTFHALKPQELDRRKKVKGKDFRERKNIYCSEIVWNILGL